MFKIGITGQSGFIGTHLFNTLGLFPDKYDRVHFEDTFFSNESQLRAFVRRCDVIVHLAAISRHPNPQIIYDTNIKLVRQLIGTMETENVSPHIIYSSSIQEKHETEYGKSKQEGRELLEEWANRSGANFTGLIFPNVYGPFCKPNYASFIATFCHKLTHNEIPQVIIDNEVKLIYIANLVNYIINKIEKLETINKPMVELNLVPCDFEKNVTQILHLLEGFKAQYFDHGFLPNLTDINEINLFNTFRSYIDYENHYPIKYIQQTNSCGRHINLKFGQEISFSKILPGTTCGNHFHIHTFERFTVLKGKTKIQLRKIGTEEVTKFYLNGIVPCYIDIPIWYSYNITNIGDEDLYCLFSINEWDVSKNEDTYSTPNILHNF